MSRNQRIAFCMTLYPGKEEQYRKRHDQIWPEMVRVLKAAGVSNYSIFLLDTTLFAYAEIEDIDKWNDLPNQDVVKKWWAYMKPLMETNPDSSPVSSFLKEIFHLD